MMKETENELIFEKSPLDVLIKITVLGGILILLICLITLDSHNPIGWILTTICFFFIIITIFKSSNQVSLNRLEASVISNGKFAANFNDIKCISIVRTADNENNGETFSLELT